MKETLGRNSAIIGNSIVGGAAPTWHSFEPIIASLLVVLFLLFMAQRLRLQLSNVDQAVIPDDKLTLRTAVEAFVGYFYDLAKSVMDPVRAKKYFPVIGTSALFVFVSNILALIPGMPVATSSLNVTLGCAAVVFILFNAYGIMKDPWGYLAHLAGPAWYLAPLLLPIEIVSLCVRPITLAVRLMLNMSVDHLLLAIITSLIGLFVPVPVLLLGCIVIIVQTLVFTLLTTIYIGLATEDSGHGPMSFLDFVDHIIPLRLMGLLPKNQGGH
jgi:F-type H+-transporting ATPase subunit a